MINRRGLLLGLASVLAAPAIVHAQNLMPVKPSPLPEGWVEYEWKPIDGNVIRKFIQIKYHIVIPTDSDVRFAA